MASPLDTHVGLDLGGVHKDALVWIRYVISSSSSVNTAKGFVAHYSISTVVSQLTRLTPANRGERKKA